MRFFEILMGLEMVIFLIEMTYLPLDMLNMQSVGKLNSERVGTA